MRHVIYYAITDTLFVELKRRVKRHKNWAVDQAEQGTFSFSFGTSEKVIACVRFIRNDCLTIVVTNSWGETIGDLSHRDFFRRAALSMVASVNDSLFRFFQPNPGLDRHLFFQAKRLAAMAGSETERLRLRNRCAEARESIKVRVVDPGKKKSWLLLVEAIDSLLDSTDPAEVQALLTKSVNVDLFPVMDPLLTIWDYTRSPATFETSDQRYVSGLRNCLDDNGLGLETLLRAYGIL